MEPRRNGHYASLKPSLTTNESNFDHRNAGSDIASAAVEGEH